jgi:hypothetical protein
MPHKTTRSHKIKPLFYQTLPEKIQKLSENTSQGTWCATLSAHSFMVLPPQIFVASLDESLPTLHVAVNTSHSSDVMTCTCIASTIIIVNTHSGDIKLRHLNIINWADEGGQLRQFYLYK